MKLSEDSVNLVAGGLSGSCVDLILFPLDTIKTRLQAKSGTVSIKSSTSNLFRGLSSAMAASFPSAAVFWTSYEWSKRTITAKVQPSESMLPFVHMGAAAGAEIATACVRNPFEVVKQQMQVGLHDSAIGAVRAILRKEGFAGLYNGYASLIFREVPFDMLQFVLYEQLKLRWAKHKGSSEFSAGENMLMGSVAGGITAVCTTPLDVVKTRLMLQAGHDVKYLGIADAFRKILQEEGARALFSGAKTRMMWISLGGAIFFGGFEEFRRQLRTI